MFDHMAWADARVIAALEAAPAGGDTAGVFRLLGHLVAAERVWLLRLRGDMQQDCPIWPEWPMDRIRATATENAQAYREFVAQLTDDDATRVVEYRNSQGVKFRNTAIDILMQVALHGSYHRGQIAMAVRKGGAAPVNTDYITYVREQSAAAR